MHDICWAYAHVTAYDSCKKHKLMMLFCHSSNLIIIVAVNNALICRLNGFSLWPQNCCLNFLNTQLCMGPCYNPKQYIDKAGPFISCHMQIESAFLNICLSHFSHWTCPLRSDPACQQSFKVDVFCFCVAHYKAPTMRSTLWLICWTKFILQSWHKI